MELENLLIPVNDYFIKEIKDLSEETNTTITIKNIETEQYVSLIDLLGLIEETNYRIDKLHDKINELEMPDEDEDYSYSGGDVRNL
jgi:hypothetical protein